ncbi:MAG: phenylalanine--tRNA ligase subunit beta, partial [Pseudohongiellaceae bacterium]
KALAMAGIMGGLASSVTEASRHIFLESAFFSPLAVAGKARSYGLQTDAAHRFERGVDYNMPRRAMERATALLLEIVGGEPGPIVDASESLPDSRQITLRSRRIESLLGLAIANDDVVDILQRLGLVVTDSNSEHWQLSVPSWRFDLAIEEDLIEELARVYGYDNLPVTDPLTRFSLKPAPESRLGLKAMRRHLTALGYQEVVTYSFVDLKLEKALGQTANEPIMLTNPISQDMSVMRSTLWTGLLNTLIYNQNRQQTRVRLFESGLRFSRQKAEISQKPGLAGLIWGSHSPEQWARDSRNNDFYDIKGDVESILDLTLDRTTFDFQAASHPALQSGQTAKILRNNQQVGWLGALNPVVQRQLDIPGKVFMFELDLEPLAEARLPRITALSRFPQTRRDLALIVDAGLEFSELERAVRETAGEFLTDFMVFDVYQGKNIEKSKKSLALGLTFQHPSRTLTDDEINGIIDSCINVLEAQFNAELRK